MNNNHIKKIAAPDLAAAMFEVRNALTTCAQVSIVRTGDGFEISAPDNGHRNPDGPQPSPPTTAAMSA